MRANSVYAWRGRRDGVARRRGAARQGGAAEHRRGSAINAIRSHKHEESAFMRANSVYA
jgi:hypothetical protein